MRKQLHFKIALISILLVILILPARGQSVEMAEALSKNAVVPDGVTLNLSNHSGDIKINTTNNKNISIETEIKVVSKTKEDAKKIIDAIKNFEFRLNGSTMYIDTRFYRSMQSNNNKTTVTLLNGDRVRIKNYTISHTLNIPKTAALKLSNKYSDVRLQSLDGKAELTLYSSKLFAGDFNGEVKMNSKYSKMEAENFNAGLILDLYDTDIAYNSARAVQLTSKYSKLEAAETKEMTIDSYDDKFDIKELESIQLKAKYSDLNSEADLVNLKLDLYDCNISVGAAENASFSGKYSELELGNVSQLQIDNSYDNDMSLGMTNTIVINESKYSKYTMAENAFFSIESSYDDDVRIDKLAADFEGISLSGKYGKLIANAGTVKYKLMVNMKYGKVDYPESLIPSKHIEKSSQLEIEAGSANSTISIQGYDNTVILK